VCDGLKSTIGQYPPLLFLSGDAHFAKRLTELYREIRVENALTDENSERVRLKPGAEVDVILEADTDATTKKSD
jgi:hypothetical protein